MDGLLSEILVCTACNGDLTQQRGSLSCTQCHREFRANDGLVRFLRGRDRPRQSKNLGGMGLFGRVSYLLAITGLVPPLRGLKWIRDPRFYKKQAADSEYQYRTNEAVKQYVDAVAENALVVVDLATGPGGGYVGPILKRLPAKSLLIATDACLPVVKHQHALFRSQYGERFVMLDVDLAQRLPFRSQSVDRFSGVCTTNIVGVADTLREVARCLTLEGRALLSERFYAEGSITEQRLTEIGHAFATMASFEASCREIGLSLEKQVDAYSGKGKSDPGDGLPLSDEDEWAQVHLYLMPEGNAARSPTKQILGKDVSRDTK